MWTTEETSPSNTHKHYIDDEFFRQSDAETQTLFQDMGLHPVTSKDPLLNNRYLPDKATNTEWCIPFWAVRGAFFKPVPRTKSREEQEYDIATPVFNHDATRRVFASGPLLNLTDQKIWMECLYLLQDVAGSQPIKINYRQMCLAIGTSYSTCIRNAVKLALTRLSEVIIEFQSGPNMRDVKEEIWSHYITPLLNYDAQTQTIQMPPVLLLLLTQQHRNNEIAVGKEKKQQIRHIRINRERHNRLHTDLGRWLHGWFLSHSKEEPLPLDILQQRTQCTTTRERDWTQLVDRSLADIMQANCFKDIRREGRKVLAQKH